jgi:hypothetical protein
MMFIIKKILQFNRYLVTSRLNNKTANYKASTKTKYKTKKFKYTKRTH